MAFKSNNNIVITNKNQIILNSFKTANSNVKVTESLITSSDNTPGDQFGNSVGVGSGRIVIGAVTENSGSGSAYIYDFSFNEVAKVSNSFGGSGQFAYSVDVGCGRVVVGDPFCNALGLNAGAAHIYNLDGTLIDTIVGSNITSSAGSGYSVSVGSNHIVVGAPNDNSGKGAATVFSLDGSEVAKLVPSDVVTGDTFGIFTDIAHGLVVASTYTSNNNTGAVYVFDTYGNELYKLLASDGSQNHYYGLSIAIGNGRIVVGAPGANNFVGKAYLYDLNGEELKVITPSNGAQNDVFGYFAASIGNDYLAIGAYSAPGGNGKGNVYLYDLDGEEVTVLTGNSAVNGSFYGLSCALGNDKLVVGAPSHDSQRGRVFTYELVETHNSYWENIINS